MTSSSGQLADDACAKFEMDQETVQALDILKSPAGWRDRAGVIAAEIVGKIGADGLRIR
jgi:hypothetical protein